MSKYEKYNKEQLIKHIEELEKQLKSTKYGLYWDKSIEIENVAEQLKKTIPSLRYYLDHTIRNRGNNNIIIEGDNLHSLTLLNMIAKNEGLIDIIYIDPPYNTGNEDFIYNDKYIDFEDGYRHSKWLSFMQKRLFLARDVLCENGMIFISIDDREQANLKILCDSIFGEHNFIACFSWMKTSTASNLSKTVRSKIEYVLLYKKNKLDFTLNAGLTDGGDVPLLNGSNKKASATFPKEVVVFKIENGVYKAGIYDKVQLHNDIIIKDGRSNVDLTLSGQFKWSQATINEEISFGTTFIIKSKKFSLRFQRLNKSVKTPSNLISKDECGVGTNEEGFGILSDIFRKDVFNYSKPVSLIKYLINMNPEKQSVILDFFAGSGTTGQAVLELNQEDGGNRRFILCTNNENNICTDVTYPRLKTVITGIRPDGTKYSDGIPANLHYFKCDFIPNVGNADQAKYNLVEKVNNLLCIAEDVFGLVDSSPRYYIYQSNDQQKQVFMYIDYFEEKSFKEFKKKIVDSKAETKIVYMFSTDNVVDELIFREVKGVEIKPIPSKIYEIYKDIVEDIKRG